MELNKAANGTFNLSLTKDEARIVRDAVMGWGGREDLITDVAGDNILALMPLVLSKEVEIFGLITGAVTQLGGIVKNFGDDRKRFATRSVRLLALTGQGPRETSTTDTATEDAVSAHALATDIAYRFEASNNPIGDYVPDNFTD